jgi:hypothetical protein
MDCEIRVLRCSSLRYCYYSSDTDSQARGSATVFAPVAVVTTYTSSQKKDKCLVGKQFNVWPDKSAISSV